MQRLYACERCDEMSREKRAVRKLGSLGFCMSR